MISCLPVYNYAFFSFLLFLAFFSLFLFSGKYYKRYILYRIIDCVSTQAWLNTRKQLVLADSLFTRSQPSLRDRFFISWKHNVLFSIYYIPNLKLPLVFSEIVFVSPRVKYNYFTSDYVTFAVMSVKCCQHPIKLQKIIVEITIIMCNDILLFFI